MDQYCGIVKGKRGVASRLGSKASGLVTQAASWGGAIEVQLYHDDETGEDRFTVRQTPWRNKGLSKLLAEGVF